MSKQATLFQTWGQKGKSPAADKTASSSTSDAGIGGLDDDEDDEQLLLAIAESLKDVNPNSNHGFEYTANSAAPKSKPIPYQQASRAASVSGSKPHATATNKQQASLFSSFGKQNKQNGDSGAPIAGPSHAHIEEELNETVLPDITNVPDLPGFDKEAGRMWIYPTNYPVREYQFNIIKSALFENTLVVLPTGLGKTFIAAVLMYNFYRWYPEGKVIFMAPTKPLVAQQIEACYNIMGIPQGDTAEMTGAMQPTERQKSWQRQRVFFLTPQVMVNDLSRGVCPFNDVRCLVVDEAHKALGNHAYCQVVRELIKYSDQFRILCLSATPGSDIKAVQQVINNMLVSHVELRTEDMPDLLPYVHERKVDKIVVPLGQELNEAKEQYLKVIGTIVQRLKRHGVIYNKEPKSFTKFMILKAREGYRVDPPENLQPHQKGAIEGDFAMLISLYHGYELLLQHGLRSLYTFLENILSGEKGHPKTRSELQRNGDFNSLIEKLRSKFVPTRALLPHTQATQQNSGGNVAATGHPKLDKLEEIVVKHFQDFADNDANEVCHKTRVMIFAQYRDSVSEIREILNRHKPLVRVMSFIGQSSAGKATRGFTQKEQLKVMKDFREGGYNTLVSTCVGEEGLDIGDVDLIVCFDAHKSPIRLVQRMGRTGRKREGRIVMLMSEGKEEQIYNQSQYSKRSIHKAILNGTKSLLYYPHNPRMIPDGLTPVCHKMHITIHTIFKPTNKSKAGPKQQKNKIKNLMESFSEAKKGNAGTKATVKSDGFLSPAELSYWSQHYKMKDKVPSLPKGAFVSLTKKLNTDGLPDLEPFDPSSSTLRLNEWMPWQNRLQQTHIVGHSNQSRQLVDLVGFMDLQEAIGEDDNYGQEMALFLNEEDILPCGQSNKPGILRYCTPKSDDQNVQQRSKVKKKARKRSVLPGFDSDVEVDSEDELPSFDKIMQRAAEARSKEQGSDDDVAILGSQKQKSTIRKKALSKTPVRRTIKTPSGKKIWLNRGLSQSQRKKLEAKKTIRLSQSQAEESRIKVIEDTNDVDDFDMMECPAPELDPALDAVREVEQLETEIEDHQEIPPHIFDSDEVLCQEELEKDDFRIEENMEVDTDRELDEIFPNFFEEKMPEKTKVTSQFRNGVNKGHVGSQMCHVPAPPSLERLDELLLDLEVRGRVSPVNVLELAEKWGSVFQKDNQVDEILELQLNGNKLHSEEKSDNSILGDATNVVGVNGEEQLPTGVLVDLEDFNETMEVENHESDNTKDRTPPRDKQCNSHSWEKSEIIPPLMTPGNHLTEQLSTSPLMSVSKMKPPRESSTPLVRTGNVKMSATQRNRPDKDKARLSGKFGALGHDSFFCEDDDEMLAAVVTPLPFQQSAMHSSKHDQSVFTFSQALMAVDSVNLESLSDKTSSSVSPGPVCDVSPGPLCTDVKEGPLGDSEEKKAVGHESEVDRRSPFSTPKKSDGPTAHAGKSEILQSPQFDLGFDLDDLDDSMVIPPSPPAVISQSLSQKSYAGHKGFNKLSQRSSLMPKPSTSTKGNKFACASDDLSSDDRQEPQDNIPAVVDQFDDIDFEESFNVLSNRTRETEARRSFTNIKEKQSSIPVAKIEPLNKGTDEVVCRTLNTNNQGTKGSPAAAEPEMEVIEIPETEFFDEMVEEDTSLKEKSSANVSSDSLDESVIAAPKIRRKAAVLLSQQSPNLSRTKDDSMFKSPMAVPKRKGASKTVKFLESSEDEEQESNAQNENDDDSDFEMSVVAMPKATSVTRSKQSRKERDKKKKKSGGRAFLDEEAELSDEEWSSDEMDCSQMDKLEASFINDGTQCSQPTNVDMRAVYMKSIRSPEMAGKFKLKYQQRPRMDVFSQGPPDEMSEYMQDSFCVDEEYDSFIDDEEIEESESLSEISIVKEVSRKKAKKEKKVTGKRKRIVMHSSSSSDDRESECEMTVLKDRNQENRMDDSKRSDNTVNPEKNAMKETGKRPSVKDDTCKQQDRAYAGIHGRENDFQKAHSVGSAAVDQRKGSASNFNVRDTRATLSQNLGSSLASRCQQRLTSSVNTKEVNQPIPDVQVSGVSSKSKPVEVPVFSLGFDDLLGEEPDDTCDTNCDTDTSARTIVGNSKNMSSHSSNSNHGEVNDSNMSKIHFASKLSTKSVAGSTAAVPKSPEELRAERLRLSRLKQEQFRQRLQQKAQGQVQTGQSKTPATPHSDATSSSFALPNSSFTNKPPNKKIAVLVDSREISGAQDIVSELRSKHGLIVEVRQLGTCDYILSNRMAVERKSITEFTNGANRAKLLERVQMMCREFERPCIVIEKDRLKPGEEKKNIPLIKSKYVENMLACLANTNIKVFFTDTQGETTNLFAELAQQEERKAFAINVKLQLTPSQNQVLAFYQSLPRVSYVTALNLMHNYKTINEFVHSVPGVIARRGVMPANRAKELSQYLKRTFNPQLISAKK